jgi:putative flippase GtrA
VTSGLEGPTLKARLARLPHAVRFIIVGGASFVGYLATMYAVVDRLGASATVGAVAAFAVGTAVSYFGNAIWTFEAPLARDSAAKFLAVTLAGLALNVAIAWILERAGVHYVVTTIVIFVTVPIFNYFAHRAWTFRQDTPRWSTRD